MGSTRHNKKRRSKTAKIRQSQKPKKILNPAGNSTVGKNWYALDGPDLSRNYPCSNSLGRNRKETMTQNYRRLGLVARLQGRTGGAETKIHEKLKNTHPLELKKLEESVVTEARVERDEDGNIIRVIREKLERANPLNDPLNELDSDDEDAMVVDEMQNEWGGIDDGEDETTDVVRQLQAEASVEYEKRPRGQSEQEVEWLKRLEKKHGDNISAMVRDRKLNPMQQTEGDIARRIKRWKRAAQVG
jgi:nucleolar protein 16